MELSDSNIKSFLIFSQKKAFLIFPEMKPYTFRPKLEKIKKTTPRKISYSSGNKNPENNFLYFLKPLQKFSIFQETETLENFLYFRK